MVFVGVKAWPKGRWGQGQTLCHWLQQTLYLVLCKKLQNVGWCQTQCSLPLGLSMSKKAAVISVVGMYSALLHSTEAPGEFLASWVFLSLCSAAISQVCCAVRRGTYEVTITQLVFNNWLSCCQIVTRHEVRAWIQLPLPATNGN